MVSVETGDTAAVCLTTEPTKDWPHGGEQNVPYHSDVAFPEKYYSENFPDNFRKIFRSGKISVAYFYILPYYITNVIGTLG